MKRAAHAVRTLHELRGMAVSNTDTGFADGAEGMPWLSTVINIALHLFLIGSFFIFAYGLVALVRERKDQLVGRSMALFIGSLVVVGSQASGSSYADFIITSLGDSRAPVFGFFGAVVPAAAGIALGYYFTRGARQSNERALRGMIIVGTIAITQFALMYAIAVGRNGSELDASVTPNVTFVAGLGLWLVLNLGIKDDPADRSQRSGFMSAVTDRVRNGSRASAPAPGQPSTGTGTGSRFHDRG